MSDIILECTNLSRTFKQGKLRVEVLKNLNLKIRNSELVAIVGASGSGKSTLLHLLGGLDAPSTGTINIAGKDILKMSERRLSRFRNEKIGFVYQFHHLLPEFDALENICMPLWIQGFDKNKAKERAAKLLDKIGLLERKDHRPAELSGGERQRIAIARALITKPDIILADEPTGNLDNKTADKVFDLILELNKASGTAMIVVTHDKELAGRMDKILELKDKTLYV